MDDVKCILGRECGVSPDCPNASGCLRCGWNPEEVALRKRTINKLGIEELKNGLYGLVILK